MLILKIIMIYSEIFSEDNFKSLYGIINCHFDLILFAQFALNFYDQIKLSYY